MLSIVEPYKENFNKNQTIMEIEGKEYIIDLLIKVGLLEYSLSNILGYFKAYINSKDANAQGGLLIKFINSNHMILNFEKTEDEDEILSFWIWFITKNDISDKKYEEILSCTNNVASWYYKEFPYGFIYEEK